MPINVNMKRSEVVYDSPNHYSRLHTLSGQRFQPSRDLMFSEAERRKTFEGWPVNFLPPEVMARAGFYYTKHLDVVKCPFCKIEVCNWEVGDDPWEDHRKWHGSCKFINNQPGTGNIPISGQEIVTAPVSVSLPSSPNDSGYDTCGSQEIRGMDVQRGEPGGVIPWSKKPSFPDYGSLEKRLESYNLWPVSLKVKPKVLSEAGFYYTGNGDQTICYYCGGGLKDWEDNDDPWVEHAKWFSKCTFILLNKGEQFVENARKSINQGGSDNQEQQSVKTTETLCQPSSSDIENGESSRDPGGQNDSMLCKLCYNKGLEVVFLPCGHLMSCIDCCLKLSTCGVCRQPITGMVRTYLP